MQIKCEVTYTIGEKDAVDGVIVVDNPAYSNGITIEDGDGNHACIDRSRLPELIDALTECMKREEAKR